MIRSLFLILTMNLLLCLGGCGGTTGLSPGVGETDTDTDSDTDSQNDGFDGVDLLIVVDDSLTMESAQQKLGTELFVLINSITAPLSSSPYAAVDNLRVAVTTTNLGFSWGGNPYEDGDGWPGDPPAECSDPSGDNGEFQSIFADVIHTEDGVIPCEWSGGQCPAGWNCNVLIGEQVGACQSPQGPGYQQPCPELDSQNGFAETLDIDPNQDLALETACMAQVGTEGCGFEQALRASVVALSREEQNHFVRDSNLLAVIFVSDEDDCSLKSNSLFLTSEIQGPSDGNMANLACGRYPEHLYSLQEISDNLNNLKQNSNEVFFAAITGVPMVDECQGPGNELDDCLDEPTMQLNEYQDTNSGSWYFEDACSGGDDIKAMPARRFVELANEHFGEMGYIYSICNDNWTPAMQEIGRTIAGLVEGDGE